MERKRKYATPELTVHGRVEDVTLLKFEGGFDGVEIQLQDGTIVTGS